MEYAGKRTKAAILAEASAGIGAAPLQIVRCFGETKEGEWRNLIVQGDNLQFLKTCYKNEDSLIKDKVKGQVKLIYIDPPFATKSDFGGKDGERSYSDKVATAEFIESLRERLVYLRELLADNGCIYLHLDCKMSHYIKVILDEIFGKERFINEITWRRAYSHNDGNRFGIITDTILWYSKSSSWIYNKIFIERSDMETKDEYPYIDEKSKKRYKSVSMNAQGHGEPKYFGDKGLLNPPNGTHWRWSQERINNALETGLIYFTANGVPRYKQFADDIEGKQVQNLWADFMAISSQSKEQINYPTQKPEELLERIILASSNPGGLVIDCFAGSGTTAAAAEKLGRRWIACDFGKHAIYTMQRRMLRIGRSKAMLEEKSAIGEVIVKVGDPYKKEPSPFCVVSSGAYDFSHIMELRKNKETYIDFVTGLFQLTRDEEKSSKYKLANIYAVIENHPVEVYPIWDDQFLKEVKIDEAYLQEIIAQSGGSLRGEYYIITPESCTNIGDTILKNRDGKDVQFHMLTFPYKVLEDISRNLVLTEQPSSQVNVNNLITSTAFYFNENVEFAAKRTSEGIKITHFDTKILNKEGKRFEGLSGLAMLLVDLDYETGKPFDMDQTVFANEIGEDSAIKIEGLTKSVGLIAIDKHGNEAKPFNLE
ncbi:MAG: site-specific DNA-methyltransferase [Pelolinea sp.]|nr:site-specific DNA-methyltransferase [Pelolinea sp.]